MKKYVVNSSERKFYDDEGKCRVETIAKTVVHKIEEDSFYMVFINYVN